MSPKKGRSQKGAVTRARRNVTSLARELESWQEAHSEQGPNATRLFVTDRSLFLRLARLRLSSSEARTNRPLATTARLAKRTLEIKRARSQDAESGKGTPRGSVGVPHLAGKKMSREAAETDVPEISQNYAGIMSRLRLGSAGKAELMRGPKLNRRTFDSVLQALQQRQLVQIRGKRVQLKKGR